ncbi:MAG: FAD binding domain-containing protein [Candidatus Hodarchaeales archaeon]|jgi:CO/xanthine dehydrogenase FAD-binding subunit
MYDFDIKSPKSLPEALELKNKYKSKIRPLAGGTDILVLARNNPDLWGDNPLLLNLNTIPDLKFIKENGTNIDIGPLTTHTQVANDELIIKHIPALAEALSILGSPQIRNLGTLVGNICHASPAADSLCILYTREASLQITTKEGERMVKISDFITNPGQTNIPENGIVTKVTIPKLSQYKSKFRTLRQRIALSIVVVSVAIELLLDSLLIVKDVRISLGAVAPTIVRAPKTEDFLRSKELTDELIEQTKELVSSECVPITDIRSNKEYRKAMIGVLVARLLRELRDEFELKSEKKMEN